MYEDLFDRLTAVEYSMLHCVNHDNQYFPGEYESAHNIGRWWEAALLLEKTTGMEIPQLIDRAMGVNFRAMTNNPYGLLLNAPEILEAFLNYHNLREALLTYTSLIEFRNSKYAKYSAEKLLDTINRRFFENTLADKEICDVVGVCIPDDTMLTRPAEDIYRYDDDTPTTGRAIEGMYKYWLVTGSPLALEVMKKTVDFHREQSICADGSPPAWMLDTFHTGHNHSYLGTIRGLLLYAIHFEDKDLIESIYLTYKNSIRRYNCDDSGFAPHDLALLRFPDHLGDPYGDHASTGDTAYIAYLLAVKCGYHEFLDDVERLIRGRLFYCQISEGEKYGAWGTHDGYFTKNSVVDVFASVAVTLCHVYNSMVEEKDDNVYVHLHFSGKSQSLSVNSRREERQNTEIIPNCSKAVYVRIPAWVSEESVCVSDCCGKKIECSKDGVYLVIPASDVIAGKPITVSFDLPVSETTSYTWITKKPYYLTWKGDSLIDVKE